MLNVHNELMKYFQMKPVRPVRLCEICIDEPEPFEVCIDDIQYRPHKPATQWQPAEYEEIAYKYIVRIGGVQLHAVDYDAMHRALDVEYGTIAEEAVRKMAEDYPW